MIDFVGEITMGLVQQFSKDYGFWSAEIWEDIIRFRRKLMKELLE